MFVGMGANGAGGYNLTDSLRFRKSASAYLERTPATAGNRKTWTWSGWIKRGSISDGEQALFHATSGNPTGGLDYGTGLRLLNGNQLVLYSFINTAFVTNNTTTQLFRDPSSWYHIVVSVDTTQAVSSDRVKIYINGEQVTSFSTAVYPTLNYDTYVNSTNGHFIGKTVTDSSSIDYLDGYMTEVNFVDGQQLTPSDFGETDTDTGVWKPKEYTGTYGTNGFYLPMKQTTQAEGFNTVLWTGNGGTQSITGVGFEPDLVWVKRRDAVASHLVLDSVRPITNLLVTDTTSAESTTALNFSSIDSNGFSLGSAGGASNASGGSYVAWCWDAGSGSPVTNNDGAVTSTVKANTAKGFSVVSWVADNSASTRIGHGLGTTPKIAIIKNRDTVSNWNVYTTAIDGSYDFLYLNTTGAKIDSGLSTFTSTTIAAGGTSTNTDNMIAYCFAEVAGYSKFGSYTGNGSSQAVAIGFRPAFLLIKNTTSTTQNWYFVDSTRSPNADNVNDWLAANLSNAETNTIEVDFTDTGFTIPNSQTATNKLNDNYIYMAFADTRDFQWNFDASGNKNNWTPNNINSNASSETTYDIMSDVPTLTDEDTANCPVYNPLIPPKVSSSAVRSISAANLYVTNSGPNGWSAIGTTMLMTSGSGKWYWEVTCSGTTSNGTMIGIHRPFTTATFPNEIIGYSGDPDGYSYYINGNKYNNSSSGVAYGASYTAGDVIGVALDMSTAESASITFYKNNTSQGVAFSSLTGDFFAAVSQAQANGLDINFGQRPFAYTPPTGFKKLNTYNLPDSSIKDGSKYFDTKLWTGNGTSQTISGLEFAPDLVWGKSRSTTGNHVLVDSIRGDNTNLNTNLTDAESSGSSISNLVNGSFDVAGGGVNASSVTMVGWSWRASDSAAVSNTNGTITSTVSANPTSGFSIISYAGSNAAGTIGHGLGNTPDVLITKNRNEGTDGNWVFWHSSMTNAFATDAYYMYLNSTQGQNASGGVFYKGTDINSTTYGFQSGNANVNASGDNYITYAFAEVEGFSKFGSYTGNGSTDGTFVYTGFRPAFVLWKRTDVSGNSWRLKDSTRNPYNETLLNLFPNSSGAENSDTAIDFVSNGFKNRSTGVNVSGGNYIYMAFAENPFKNSLAR